MQVAAEWKKSIWARLVALGFIGLIILGNIRLVELFGNKEPSETLATLFMVFAGVVLVCGAALGAERLLVRFARDSDEARDHDAHNSEV